MLTLKLTSEETERVIRGLEKKHFEGARGTVNQVLTIDKPCQESQQKLSKNKQQANLLAKKIGGLMKDKKLDEANEVKAQVTKLKEEFRGLQQSMETAENDLTTLLCTIPNIPNEDVPEGKDAPGNAAVKEGGTVPELGKDALCHWDLCKEFNLIDFDLGVKITGAGFPLYIDKMARLQRAFGTFLLEETRKSGYLEVQPPFVANQASGYGTGQLPNKEDQIYHVQLDNLYLIPTAEVPIANIFHDEILGEKDLPIKRCAYSVCFRREAGLYGKDVRGLNRLYQFDKAEIVHTDKPEHSYESLNEMLEHIEGLCKKLELPYHILKLCGGDMSFTSSIYYDFEVWNAAQKRWLEVSSVSNFENYQVNRLKCCYRYAEDGKIGLCHMLNGSALALPRIVASILENSQTPENIRVPKVFVPCYGFEMIDDQNS